MDGQDPWWWRPATDDYHDDMLFDFSSDSDPLELALGDEGEAVAAGQPVVPCDRSPPPQVTPPSEDMMAAWLYPIVSGEDHVSDDLKSLMAEETIRPAVRRRCKIAERLKTLQQLVPGCDKSNQASTLEQTIQYMKSLQQHLVRGMNMRPPPQAGAAAAAVYPVVMPPAMAAAAVAVPMPPASAVVATAGMVPYGGLAPAPMLPYLAMVMHAAAAPFYPPAAQAAASAAPPDAAGGQCSVAMEQQQKEEKGSYTTGSSAGYIS
ncbi:hypothetical protein BRADI_4g02670v3 [Brachypodium distachyon]|uniref:BHLH domain-containing protein n=1 Tax=Brachypodium distachyon TaxID=15368 RepID=A0A0Q3HCX8_BRADI|nr:hypothetical protein BRADI_4g02670v3 [Brachypodium distachyon]